MDFSLEPIHVWVSRYPLVYGHLHVSTILEVVTDTLGKSSPHLALICFPGWHYQPEQWDATKTLWCECSHLELCGFLVQHGTVNVYEHAVCIQLLIHTPLAIVMNILLTSPCLVSMKEQHAFSTDSLTLFFVYGWNELEWYGMYRERLEFPWNSPAISNRSIGIWDELIQSFAQEVTYQAVWVRQLPDSKSEKLTKRHLATRSRDVAISPRPRSVKKTR